MTNKRIFWCAMLAEVAAALHTYLDQVPSASDIYEYECTPKRRQRISADHPKEGGAPTIQLGVTPISGCAPTTVRLNLACWAGEIASMWRFTRNSGITEGFQNQNGTLTALILGFRNFQKYSFAR